jgi:hypothetical protein
MLYKRGYERTSFIRNQKTASQKIAKENGISVAELVRRIIDQDFDREQKQKG